MERSQEVGEAKPPGSGWEKIPGGDPSHQGFRKKDGNVFRYWYPSKNHAEAAAGHHDDKATYHTQEANMARDLAKSLGEKHPMYAGWKKVAEENSAIAKHHNNAANGAENHALYGYSE